MRLEPWCFPPTVIAQMTDYEIWHEYVAPEMRRQEALERQRKGLPQPEDEDDPPPPFKPTKQFMMTILTSLGMSKAEAEKEYERQKKADDAMQAQK